jgi:hypothetical protein
MKKGPYFENQQASDCGCFYPDCSLLGHDGKGNRLTFCTRHEFNLRKIRRSKFNPEHLSLRLNKMPTEKWRNKERKRMQGQHRVFQKRY